MIMETKTCNKCGETKILSSFYQRKDRGTYLGKCEQCVAAHLKTWRLANPGKTEASKRKSWLKKTYGVDLEWYEGMLMEQGGCCAICGTQEVYKNHSYFCIDHNHDTGTVRGLLCSDCNVGIARLGENPETIRKAAQYLEAHQ